MALAGSLELQLLADVARISADMKKVESVVSGSMQRVTQAAQLAMRALGSIGVAVSAGAFVAFVKNVNNAVDALNDLKDATGSSIENISALEDIARRNGATLETVGTALMKFNQALGGTVKPGTDAEKVLSALGLSAKELRELDPSVAMMKTAQALAKFADDGGKARAVQELFGKSLREVAPLLKDMAEKGELVSKVTTAQAEEAEKFNKHLFNLQKNAIDAGRALVANFVPALNAVFEAFNKGGFKAALDQLGNQLFDWEGNAQRKGIASLQKELTQLNKAIQLAENFNQPVEHLYESWGKVAGALSKARQEYFKFSDVQGGRGNVNPPLADLRASLEGAIKDGPKATKVIQELTEAEKDLIYHRKFKRDSQVKETEEYLKNMAAEKQAAEDAYKGMLDASQKSLEKLQEEVAAQREANERIGLTTESIEQLEVAKLRDLAASKERNATTAEDIDFSGRLSAKLREEAQALRNLADAKEAGAGKKAAFEAGEAYIREARRAEEEWKRTNERIADSFVDNLMAGGKSVTQYLKDLFRTLELRPLLQPVGQLAAGVANAGISMVGNAIGMGNLLGSAGVGMGTTASLGFANATGAGMDAFLAANGGFGTMAAGESLAGMASAIPGVGWAIAAAMLIASLANGGETRVGGQYVNGQFVDGPSGGQINGASSLFGSGSMLSINSVLSSLGATSSLTRLVGGVEQSQNGKGFAYAGGTLSNGIVIGQGTDGMGYMNRRGSMTDQEALAAATEEMAQLKLEAVQASDAVGPLADWVRSLGDISLLTGEALSTTVARFDKALAERQSLEARLFELTATDAEKLQKTRDAERASVDATNLALLEQIYALEDLQAAADRTAEAMREAAEYAAAAAADLMSKLKAARPFFMTPAEWQTMQAQDIANQYNFATGASITPEFVLGITPEEFRAYFEEFTAAGNDVAAQTMINIAQAFIDLQGDIEAAGQTLRNLQAEGQSLDVQILRAMGNTAGADALQRSLDTAGMSADEIALYDLNAEKRAQLAAILKAAQDAADAEKLLADRRRAQIEAARRLAEEWKQIGESMLEETMRLRGAIAGSQGPSAGLAFQQAQFALALAAAQSGDIKARGNLVGLAQGVEQAAMTSVGSLAELNTIRAGLAATLEAQGLQAIPRDAVTEELRATREVIRQQRDEVVGLRTDMKEANKKMENLTRDINERFDKWDNNGGTDAGLIVQTVAG